MVCREEGFSVPEEVAVIGVDNDDLRCEASFPPLTSVALNTRQIGHEAAATLDGLMRGTEPPSVRVVPPRGIITRTSTDTHAIPDRHVAVAMGFIRRHACNGIDVSDVLKNVPLSRRTLERRFKQHLYTTPLHEIHRIRLNRVKKRLLETELTLEAIADLSGFSQAYYMASLFRHTQQMTSGEVRVGASHKRVMNEGEVECK